jgi:predicted transcriptional regulator of viral defense system
MPADRSDLRRRLTALAARQSGYFTAAQALEVGYAYPAQRYHAERGNWIRVERAIFRLPEWPSGRHDDLVRWSLWSRGKAVVSHETALVVHDLGDVNPERVHLTVPPGFKAKAPGAVLHRAVLLPGDVSEHEGFRVTTPLRTLLDVAAMPLEQGQLDRAVDDALERGLVSRKGLRNAVADCGPVAALAIERSLARVVE